MYANFQEKIFAEISGKKFQTFHCRNVTTMTCLVGKVLKGTGMKLHTSMLGTFFVYTLGLSMPIFKKKSSWRFLGKSSKLWVLHKNDFLCNTQSLELFPRRFRRDFFLKIGIHRAKVYTKKVPNIEVCDFIPGSSRTSPI